MVCFGLGLTEVIGSGDMLGEVIPARQLSHTSDLFSLEFFADDGMNELGGLGSCFFKDPFHQLTGLLAATGVSNELCYFAELFVQ